MVGLLAAHRNKSEESAEHNLTGRPKHQLTERQSVQPKTLGARFHGVNYNMVPLAACIVNPDAGYRGQAIKGASYQRGQAVVGLGCRLNRAFMPFLTTPCRCYGLTPFDGRVSLRTSPSSEGKPVGFSGPVRRQLTSRVLQSLYILGLRLVSLKRPRYLTPSISFCKSCQRSSSFCNSFVRC